MILVVMGVSGVGKTTIARLLSERIGWRFEDADAYHSQANREKMAAGIPLNDADREPWLKALHDQMASYASQGESAILACSALKQKYRDLLAGGFADSEFRFVYLHAPADLIAERITMRHHEYMNPALLRSQLQTLEEPAGAWPVSVAGSAEQSVEEIVARLRQAGVLAAQEKTK